jgi:hypothetical protein
VCPTLSLFTRFQGIPHRAFSRFAKRKDNFVTTKVSLFVILLLFSLLREDSLVSTNQNIAISHVLTCNVLLLSVIGFKRNGKGRIRKMHSHIMVGHGNVAFNLVVKLSVELGYAF